jgi:hypothetical protein
VYNGEDIAKRIERIPMPLLGDRDRDALVFKVMGWISLDLCT